MKDGYAPLLEKEEMWAKMFIQVLEDNNIPFATVPVYGAGFSMRTGIQERLKVFVPAENLAQAAELAEELFSAKSFQEEA